jgi:ribosomal protein L37AE/L43A
MAVVLSMRKNMAQSKRPKECPECGSGELIPIQYGMPGGEMMEESFKGKIKLGGCCIWPEAPNWHCKKCEHEWLVEPGPGQEWEK